MKMQIALISFAILFTFGHDTFAGGSSVNNGGDWFVRTLPLLKMKLPEDFGVVEGVQYKKVGLRKCETKDIARLDDIAGIPDTVNVINLPDRDWNALQVLIENGKHLVCSLGIVDANPLTSLETLVNNEDTNRILYEVFPGVGRQIKYSKSLGTIGEYTFRLPAMGTFLINRDPRGSFIGYNLQDGLRVLGFPHSLYFKPESTPQDFVYIPLSIQDRDRVYFVQTVIDNSLTPVWRIVLPIAIAPENLPLPALAEAIQESKDGTVWESFYGIKFDPFTDPQLTKALAWTSASNTTTSQRLRNELVNKFGVSLLGAMHSPDLLKPVFNVSYVPSIADGELNHPAFRHGSIGGEIVLPIVSQRWRIGADIVHELTHALLGPCGAKCNDERIFEMEMEAHLNERQHLKEMTVLSPLTKFANDAFNFLVAASLPNVEWADSIQTPVENELCEDVILNYGLDKTGIRPITLRKYSCH